MTLQAPWSDKAIKANWPEIEAVARQHSLPMPTPVGRKFDELGCGHYGCVMSTSNDEVVFKLTSDPTEAAFIQRAGPLGWPDGIVKYYAITGLEATYRKRKIYAIWREAAFDVGTLYQPVSDQYENMSRKIFARYLENFQNAAGLLRTTLQRSKDPDKLLQEAKDYEDRAYQHLSENTDPKNYRGAYRVAAAWRVCEIIAEMLENSYLADSVGGALRFYLENGFLLADVHGGNVGRVLRSADYAEGNGPWVITDPGHVVRVAL